MRSGYDFGGYATRNDLKCSDGRTIRKDAFADNDGQTVPLVWQHMHNDVENVLGHALLENREDGVYCWGKFNESPKGRMAKDSVRNGDIKSLSIYANQLKETGGNVLHGAIREVSLVLAGANPGAFIDFPFLEHGDDSDVNEAFIYMDQPLELMHADKKEEEEEKKPEEKKEEKEEPKKVADDAKKTTETKEGEGKTVADVLDTLTDEQKEAVYYVVGKAVEEAEGKGGSTEKEEVEHDDMEGTDFMKHNVFDQGTVPEDTLSHAEIKTIIDDGKKYGSLKESFLAHKAEYGIDNIEWLFPEDRMLNTPPEFIKRKPDDWVNVVMSGVHHSPFSRIKMMFADLREDDARAKGYAKKGKLKKEEVFGLLKRSINPTTIYKKQKLDRDDIIDITDFDVVSWLKGEMRMMLDEELARAFIFGDGRSTLSEDKISESNIIPVVKEEALYKMETELTGNFDPEAFIDACVRAQNNYEGSGNITMFIGNSRVTDLLLIKDADKHRMYKDLGEVALACAVNRIVKVPDTIVPEGVYAVMLDLNDYNVGADKGGAVSMFDDFDIDYNQQKYLIETRCSGCLTKPFSAIVIKKGE